MNSIRYFLFVFSLGLFLGHVFAAEPSRHPEPYPKPYPDYGAKYYRNYSRKDYNSQAQNWCIQQDKKGFIYAANQGAVLEYDGVSWQEILMAGKNARSLAVNHEGTILVGGNNELGYLQADPKGVLRFMSLVHLIDSRYRDFGYVWRTYATEQGIYFCTSSFLFLFHSNQFTVWQSETSFSPPFLCDGKLLVRQQGQGLLEIKNGGLRLLPGSEPLALESVYTIVTFSPGTLLIGTATQGFFLYKDHRLVPFKTPDLDTVAANQLTYGMALADGNFALATRKGGVFIMDATGHLKLHFETSLGLQDNMVWHIYQDTNQNLWLALNNGITKLEYHSPFSIFDIRRGLKGMVFAVARFGPMGRLYAGTDSGLFLQNDGGMFVPVPGITGDCQALLPVGESLLVGTSKGVFQLTPENQLPRPLSESPTYVFFRSPNPMLPILAGTNRGLLAFSQRNQTGEWQVTPFMEEITEDIRTMAEDKQGNLWLASPGEGVIKISLPSTPNLPATPLVRRYPPSWFPVGVETHVFYAADHIIIATGKGIFRWDEYQTRFVPDLTLGETFAGGEKGKSVYRMAEDSHQNIWFHTKARNRVAIRQQDGTYRIAYKEFPRIPLSHVNAIYPDPRDGSIWLASVDALIRFENGGQVEHPAPFGTFLRGVWANEVFVTTGQKDVGDKNDLQLPFKHRSLRFAFAAPFFEAEQETLYQCRLDGYDADWTGWSHETKKDYTNLEPGLNVFRVRAKNLYGGVSDEAAFHFFIQPPWYRSWWAYCLYFLVGLLLIAGLVRWRSATLLLEKQQLEAIIGERTREIHNKNQQLVEMAKIKSNFFANISHEFRTPLTLILGPLEQMIAATTDPVQQKKLHLMLRNGQRLLNLINQLLELSKFDSGTVTLNPSSQDIVSFLKGLIASFELLTARKDQELLFCSHEAALMLSFDVSRMEEICCNLLINAIKFTPAGGSITVAVAQQNLPAPLFPRGYVELVFSDTGPGIPADQLAKIFDRFYYSDHIYEYDQKGAGIGLAIVKELVELHHGTITVENKEGDSGGSCFTLRFPLGQERVEPPPDLLPCHTLPMHRLLEEIDSQSMDTEEPPSASEPLTSEKELILVVEDSADVCQYIRGALEPQYTVLTARDGIEGIEKALQIIPDLIVSDIMMPRADGYLLCKTLKQDRCTSHIPIILLTAKASEDNIISGLETGADDYITKPFSTRILCARIKNLIDIRHQLQQNHRREMTLAPVKTTIASIDREFLKELHQMLEHHLSDEDFNVELLAKKMIMGRSTLYRKIEALCGENPTDYIRSYRLKRAAQLLQEGSTSVTEVAFEVGFNSRTYFTKCFKEMFNQLPSEFKKTPTNLHG